MNLTLSDISSVSHRVFANYDIKEAYLFGSYARGEETEESDIDIRLLCGPSVTFGTLFDISQALESELGRSIDLVTNPPERMRPAFRDCIQKDEVMLY